MSAHISRDRFEREYAERSRKTVDEIHALGLHALPCDCEYEGCQGWGMIRNPCACGHSRGMHMDDVGDTHCLGESQPCHCEEFRPMFAAASRGSER